MCNCMFDVFFLKRDHVKGVNVRCEASDCFHFIALGQLCFPRFNMIPAGYYCKA